MPAQKDRNNQADQAEIRPLIPQDVRDSLIGKCSLKEVDTLAARLDALATAAHTRDIEAVRMIAKESKSKAYKQVTDAIISAIERGNSHIAYSELNEMCYSAFRFTPECYAAITVYQNRLRAERSQSKGGSE